MPQPFPPIAAALCPAHPACAAAPPDLDGARDRADPAAAGGDIPMSRRLLAGWNAGVTLYLVLLYWRFRPHLGERYPASRRGRGRRSRGHPGADGRGRARQHRRHRGRARHQPGRRPQRGTTGPGDRHHRAVLGLHPHHLRPALRPRVLRVRRRERWARLPLQGAARLLGLRLLLIRDRHRRAGFRRRDRDRARFAGS